MRQAVEMSMRSVRDDTDVLAHGLNPQVVPAEQLRSLVDLHIALQHRATAQRIGVLRVQVSREGHGLAISDEPRCGPPGFVGDQVQGPAAVV